MSVLSLKLKRHHYRLKHLNETSHKVWKCMDQQLEADRISFSAFYFSVENRWRIFGLKIPKNCRKMHWADGQSLESKHFAAAAATSLHAAWLTVYQQVARRMAIARRRWYSPDYTASVQVIKSRHFELGPGANRHVRSHCPDNETHSTLANKRCQRPAI